MRSHFINFLKVVFMDLGLKNKVIVVTGSARGMHESIIRVLSEEGAAIAIVRYGGDDDFKLPYDIGKAGGRVFSVESERGEPAACEKAVGAIVQNYGRIEGLVNYMGIHDVAGPGKGYYRPFMESLHRNLLHYYLMAHFALPSLKISRGAIVNINLKTAENKQADTQPYTGASGGFDALTREWAVELLKYGIRVNAVNVSENRMPAFSEIAHTVAFLLSEKSSHTTGQFIHVAGCCMHQDSALADD